MSFFDPQDLRNDLYEVPAEFRPYAFKKPSNDILDESHGIPYIVVLKCQREVDPGKFIGCWESWGWHWKGVEAAFRKHLLTCPALHPNEPQANPAPPKTWNSGFKKIG